MNAAAKRNLAQRILRAITEAAPWTRADAQPILDALGPGFTLVGSVATHGQSANDLDVLQTGVHPAVGIDISPRIIKALRRFGFVYVGQSTVSPEEKQAQSRAFGTGWSEIHHFVNKTTSQRIEVWTCVA